MASHTEQQTRLGRGQQGSERGHRRGQLLRGNADSTVTRLQWAVQVMELWEICSLQPKHCLKQNPHKETHRNRWTRNVTTEFRTELPQEMHVCSKPKQKSQKSQEVVSTFWKVSLCISKNKSPKSNDFWRQGKGSHRATIPLQSSIRSSCVTYLCSVHQRRGKYTTSEIDLFRK